MTEEAAESRNEAVGLEEWERNVCMAVTCRDLRVGCGQKDRVRSDTGAASSSDTLNLPPNTVFRETSHQWWPCLQVFRITTLLFTVAKKTLTLPHYKLFTAIQ